MLSVAPHQRERAMRSGGGIKRRAIDGGIVHQDVEQDVERNLLQRFTDPLQLGRRLDRLVLGEVPSARGLERLR